MRVVLSSEASGDLEQIVEEIAIGNHRRAATFVAELRTKCLSPSATPEAFPVVGAYRGASIRRRVHSNYLIFYRLQSDNVVVRRILHGARDYTKILGLSSREE